MLMRVPWSLCDAVKAAIQAAKPTWVVEVVLDAERDIGELPTDGDPVEVHLAPFTNEEVRPEGSRRAVQGEVSIGIRLRVKLGKGPATDFARTKCEAWDELVAVVQRRQGFDCGEAGTLHWFHGMAGIDLEALRQDKVLSIVAPGTLFHELRSS